MERRYSPHSVQLEERDSGPPLITGYAAVFYRADDPGTEYTLFPGLVERIEPSAFSSIGNDDVRGLYNHDPRLILGRSKAGTLRLSVDARGLRYEIEPPQTAMAGDIIASLRRGDVDGSSFAFRVRPKGARFEDSKDGKFEVRVLTDLEVFDVGPVTYPAYGSTTAGLRSAGSDDDALRQWQAWRRVRDADRVRVFQRMRTLRK